MNFSNDNTIAYHCKCVLNANTMTSIQLEQAIMNRILYLAWDAIFTDKDELVNHAKRVYKADPKFKTKEYFRSVADGFLWLLLQHYKLFKLNGNKLRVTPLQMNRTKRALLSNDLFFSWFKSNYVFLEDSKSNRRKFITQEEVINEFLKLPPATHLQIIGKKNYSPSKYVKDMLQCHTAIKECFKKKCTNWRLTSIERLLPAAANKSGPNCQYQLNVIIRFVTTAEFESTPGLKRVDLGEGDDDDDEETESDVEGSENNNDDNHNDNDNNNDNDNDNDNDNEEKAFVIDDAAEHDTLTVTESLDPRYLHSKDLFYKYPQCYPFSAVGSAMSPSVDVGAMLNDNNNQGRSAAMSPPPPEGGPEDILDLSLVDASQKEAANSELDDDGVLVEDNTLVKEIRAASLEIDDDIVMVDMDENIKTDGADEFIKISGTEAEDVNDNEEDKPQQPQPPQPQQPQVPHPQSLVSGPRLHLSVDDSQPSGLELNPDMMMDLIGGGPVIGPRNFVRAGNDEMMDIDDAAGVDTKAVTKQVATVKSNGSENDADSATEMNDENGTKDESTNNKQFKIKLKGLKQYNNKNKNKNNKKRKKGKQSNPGTQKKNPNKKRRLK